jgi:hypothetical protein
LLFRSLIEKLSQIIQTRKGCFILSGFIFLAN